MPQTSYISVHDQFCGAGGNSIAVEAEGGEVTHAWNHDPIAIASHSANFPKTEHEETDIFDVDPSRYEPATVLVTSPACTDHTDAKGTKKPTTQLTMFEDDEPDPDEERSRMTMAQVVRFAKALKYEAIVVENVVQITKWRHWETWLRELRALDYNIQIVYWNSAFFAPTPQSRDRIYIICTKKHLPLPDLRFTPRAWCSRCGRDVDAVQVFKKPARPWGKWGERNQYQYRCPNPRCAQVVIPYYYCAYNLIDWSLPSPKIGAREKPLKPNTIKRVRAGLERFGQQPGIADLAYAYEHNKGGAYPLTEPYPTQTTAETRGLYVPPFLLGQQSGGTAKAVTDLSPTIAGAGAISLTTPPFVMPLDRSNDPSKHSHPLTAPLASQTARQDKALVVPPYMITLRNHADASELTQWLSTIAAGGNHHGLVTPPGFISSYYREDASHALTDPLPTLPALDHHALVTPPPFIASYYGGRDAVSPLTALSPALTAELRHSLVTPGGQIDVDECGFRMLHWTEVRTGMAFPGTYILKGNDRQKVSQLGNAVTPPVVRFILHAVFAVLNPRQV